MTLFLDLESYSETPLKNGVYRYAENSEVMLVLYAFDDEPVQAWDVTTGASMPDDLADAIYNTDCEVVAHAAMFDRTVLRLSQLKIEIPIERWRCSMVRALAHSLPGSLERVGEILKIDADKQKLKVGKQLVRLFCVPRPKNSKLRRATRETHPQEWAQFVEYGKIDVEAMRACYRKLPSWNYSGFELSLWHLDQRVADRGIAIDLDLAHAAIRSIERTQQALAGRTIAITNGEVEAATQRDKLLAHILAEYAIQLPDMKSDTLERRIDDPELPEELRELLRVRLASSMTSGSKYKRALNGVSSDGRLRGLMQFDGADRTGRWAHRMFQPGNLPRPDREAAARWYGRDKVSDEEVAEYVSFGIESLLADADDLVFDEPMPMIGSAVRGCLIAPPGKKLVISDLANIEGRKAAWLAGETWKLKAFAEYDAGTGPDLYKLAYAKAFGIYHEDVKKDQRQIGKVMELMLQYQGGVGAFITGAVTYSIDLNAMADAALPTIPLDVLEEAEGFYEWTVEQKRTTFGLDRRVFIACDSLKRLWRRAHPRISSMWSDLEYAVRSAIRSPGNNFGCRALTIRRDGNWLRIRLPSGRFLCYASPAIDDDDKITYMGLNRYSRKWQRLHTYGGKTLEQCTQGSSRDVFAHGMPAAEAAGYEIVVHMHDELGTETPDTDEFSADGLSSILATAPTWATGLPLAASGFETYRYRKD